MKYWCFLFVKQSRPKHFSFMTAINIYIHSHQSECTFWMQMGLIFYMSQSASRSMIAWPADNPPSSPGNALCMLWAMRRRTIVMHRLDMTWRTSWAHRGGNHCADTSAMRQGTGQKDCSRTVAFFPCLFCSFQQKGRKSRAGLIDEWKSTTSHLKQERSHKPKVNYWFVDVNWLVLIGNI